MIYEQISNNNNDNNNKLIINNNTLLCTVHLVVMSVVGWVA